MDADREPAGVRQALDDGDPPGQVDVRDQLGEVVGSDDPVGQEAPAIRLDRGLEPVTRRLRSVAGHQLRGALVQHPGRRAVVVATDLAVGRVGGGGIDPGRGHRRRADPDLVQLVRPQEGGPAGCDAVEVGRGRPAAPADDVPARAFEPCPGLHPAMRRGHDLEALVERRGRRQVDLVDGTRRLDKVDVRVGQCRERDLIVGQHEPAGRRPGEGLDVGPASGDRHPAARDPDGLDPAEAALPGQGRDAADDEQIEGHDP